MTRKLLASLFTALYMTTAFAAFTTISGCNTMEGAGKDIESGGKAIKEEAKENKKY